MAGITCVTAVKVNWVTRLGWVVHEEDGSNSNGANNGNSGNDGNDGNDERDGNDSSDGKDGNKLKPAEDIRGTSCKQRLRRIHIWYKR